MIDAGKLGGVASESVRFLTGSGQIYVPNEPTTLTVTKLWYDEDGKKTTPPVDEVKIDLIQQAVKSNAIPVSITSKSTLQWGGTPITTVTYVAPGSDLTITVNAWTSQPLKIQIGESEPIEMDYSSGVHAYTVRNITSSLNIQVLNEKDTNVHSYAVSGYTEPFFEPIGGGTVHETATLNAGNNWSCTWNDLPKEDGSGNRYYYRVQEVTEVPGFHVTYSRNNADGVQAGELVVINQASGYVLPETGGPGTRKIAAAGALLLLLSAAGLLLRAARLRGERSP